MRLKLLRRRLTISAPRVSVRSAMPWPVRWVLLAIFFGLCAALALWAFEFGKSIAGLDSRSRAELVRLREEVAQLREEQRLQKDTSSSTGTLLTAERTTMDRLMAQMRQLEADNRALRDDLGFFEKLIPAGKTEGVSIRGLQADVIGGNQLRWQVLVIQPVRNAPEFRGRLELLLAGTRDGRPWTQAMSADGQPLQFQQYRRVEGLWPLPGNAVVKTVTARVLEGSAVRATQTLSIEE
ncbi:DUF6776 family protein [Acidovorax sp. SUPP2539]|uniref:DUF6776 family protein n=1 Tax=Acidovorax sp. SUPP2539 TaxID=2920878 RepID=UPI0024E0BA0C|nr:DUF6776 family protein [Acidovorax sp. SUPP2539]